MHTTFQSLTKSHLSLLLKWLEAPHVKSWWDQNITWTPELIEEKYGNYIRGYKGLCAYIICADQIPIGYIQCYNIHNFPREPEYDISTLPKSCAGLDWYIGEVEFINKGIGSKTLKLFLDLNVAPNFDYVFVDPDTDNVVAIRTYNKVGFRTIGTMNNGKITLMMRRLT